MPSLLDRLCGDGKADAGVVIPSVSVLSLQPDDVLVLSVQHRLNQQQREACVLRWARPCLVIACWSSRTAWSWRCCV
ncbi:hypothetical protein [Cupriavidus sp. UYPR2.512]|uniref:hypothetical protein n=1 Tax=Cupriavidus sp. UYPR2.512 TaxID=1080187 RepID=UPI00037CC24E|nr:hypothetical protein [Cupriavidus sp. UYPR2.512]UIF89277.1 hypothetical protein KAF44_30360 [Cupriavidus necator]